MLVPLQAHLIEQPINRVIQIQIGPRLVRKFYVRRDVDGDIVLDCDSPKAQVMTCGDFYNIRETYKPCCTMVHYQGMSFIITDGKPCYYSKDEPTNQYVITFNLIAGGHNLEAIDL